MWGVRSMHGVLNLFTTYPTGWRLNKDGGHSYIVMSQSDYFIGGEIPTEEVFHGYDNYRFSGNPSWRLVPLETIRRIAYALKGD